MTTSFNPDMTITKLMRIRKEIDETINLIKESYVNLRKGRIVCVNCGVMNIRMRKDKTYFCRTCAYDSRKEIKNDKNR